MNRNRLDGAVGLKAATVGAGVVILNNAP